MKIQCDVCNKNEASVFCTADEATLCDECDHRVHHANKLAFKHQRLSLLQSSTTRPPMCDICQDKRAVIFCQEDRAILCRECDIPLHRANEYTQRHNRFLLTGIKLSTTISNNNNNTIINKTTNGITTTTTDNYDIGGDTTVPDYFKPFMKSPIFEIPSSTTDCIPVISNIDDQINNTSGESTTTSSTSNISDYLLETLPGWHFDDFILDPPSSTAPFGFCKNVNNNDFERGMLSFFDMGHQHENSLTNYSTQFDNLWVPQAPQASTIKMASTLGETSIFDASQNGLVQFGTKQQETNVNKTTKIIQRKSRKNDAFAVPQITSSLGSSKRSGPYGTNL